MDLPSEVVARIARLCCTEIGGWDSHSRRVCSLTCRYWARLARRELLGSITLKGAADVSQLLEYLNAPTRLTPSLRDCIRFLWLAECQVACKPTPWLHHLVRLKPKLHPDVSVWVRFTASSSQSAPAGSEVALRTSVDLPFTALPRTLPSSILQLGYLTLRGIHLPSPTYLLRHLSHLNVADISLEQVTFADLSMLDMRLHTQRIARREVTIESDMLSNTEYFCSYFALAHRIMTAQGCPSLDEHITSLVKDYVFMLLPSTMLCSIYVSYDPRDPDHPYSASNCSCISQITLS